MQKCNTVPFFFFAFLLHFRYSRSTDLYSNFLLTFILTEACFEVQICCLTSGMNIFLGETTLTFSVLPPFSKENKFQKIIFIFSSKNPIQSKGYELKALLFFFYKFDSNEI